MAYSSDGYPFSRVPGGRCGAMRPPTAMRPATPADPVAACSGSCALARNRS